MVNPATFLDDAGRERVRAAVQAAEATTAGEIRVLIVGRSVPVLRWPSFVLLVAGAAVAYAVRHVQAWGHPDGIDALLAGGTGLAGFLLGMLVPADPHRWVRRRAEREFVDLGIGRTAGSTGVLILLSLREHEAVVLADRAIHEKAPGGTWEKEVAVIVEACRRGAPAEGLAAAVADVGAQLARHFPRKDDDVNELPDDVVTRK